MTLGVTRQGHADHSLLTWWTNFNTTPYKMFSLLIKANPQGTGMCSEGVFVGFVFNRTKVTE